METIYLSHSFEPAAGAGPCVVALGSFDGVHIAHQLLIGRAAALAREEGAALAVMTFDPHPRQVVVGSNQPMQVLTPLAVKERIFSSFGVERLYVVRFDESTAKLSPGEFVCRYLRPLGVRHVVAGFDFRFGFRGAGTVETLGREGNGFFAVHQVEEQRYRGHKIGSTFIRKLVERGMVEDVPDYLGRHYELAAVNVAANRFKIAQPFILPATGTYLTEFVAGGRTYFGICSVDDSRIITLSHSTGKAAFVGEGARFRWLKRLGRGMSIDAAVSNRPLDAPNTVSRP